MTTLLGPYEPASGDGRRDFLHFLRLFALNMSPGRRAATKDTPNETPTVDTEEMGTYADDHEQ